MEYALAWSEGQAEKCSGCGHPRTETMSSDADGGYTAHSIRCHACAAREREAEKFGNGNSDTHGLHFYVTRD